MFKVVLYDSLNNEFYNNKKNVFIEDEKKSVFAYRCGYRHRGV